MSNALSFCLKPQIMAISHKQLEIFHILFTWFDLCLKKGENTIRQYIGLSAPENLSNIKPNYIPLLNNWPPFFSRV